MTTDDGALNPSTTELDAVKTDLALAHARIDSLQRWIRRAKAAFAILTVASAVGLFFLQQNYQHDDVNQAAQTVKVCHALADVNQSVIDFVTIQAIDTPVTESMTPDLRAATERANEKRKVFRDIAANLFPLPACDDGYQPKSKSAPVIESLRAQATSTLPPAGTTTTTR